MEYVPKKNLPENLLPVSEIKINIYKSKFVLASDSGFVKFWHKLKITTNSKLFLQNLNVLSKEKINMYSASQFKFYAIT